MMWEMSNYANLFSPGKIGSLYLKNRIVMGPIITRLASENGAITAEMTDYYSERALGGVGLIITEAMGVDYPLAFGQPYQVRIHDDRYMPAHAKFVERIHECGAKVFASLWHTGINRGLFEGEVPVGPSAIFNSNTGITSRELSVDEIRDIVEKFGQAARRAMICGYDGVSVHAAHGYLISSFVSRATNERNDQYGGSFENRIHFALEIISAVQSHTRKDFPVICRINGDDFQEKGVTIEESTKFAVELEKAGVAAIDVSAGVYSTMDKMIEPIQYSQGWKLYLSETIRKYLHIPVFGVGVIHDPEFADRAIGEGKADFLVLARELLCEPMWASKAMAGDQHYRKCICCNYCLQRGSNNLPVRCAINPLSGREQHVPKRADKTKHIAVVGAGPAGVTAAVIASKRGHKVDLFESESSIGGQLLLAGVPPQKDKICGFVDYLKKEIVLNKVNLHLNTVFSSSDAEKFDNVVLAVGASPKKMSIKGAELITTTAWDVLKSPEETYSGKNVIVIGAGSVGCETALFLESRGAESVAVVEILPRIASDLDGPSRIKIVEELENASVELFTSSKLEFVEGKNAAIFNVGNKSLLSIPCDLIVVAIGATSSRELAEQLFEKGIAVQLIGDAHSVGRIGEAVHSGFDAVASL